jgi:hypothetical protein
MYKNKLYYKKVVMADLIKELYNLPVKTQEAILENLSNDMVPIEIDGNVFMIRGEVSKLIDNLVIQISDLKKRVIDCRIRE